MEATSVQKNQRFRKTPAKSVPKKVESESEDEEELCFICTEPVTTFAVSECDHRTCHRCSLRLRALYETRNCAYCKVSFFFLLIFIYSFY